MTVIRLRVFCRLEVVITGFLRLQMRQGVDNSRKEFYVVRLLGLPHEDIDDCVCVPRSWMKSKRSKQGKVSVAYPIEDPIVTKERVEKRQKHSKRWKFYEAVVKYSTNYYYDAEFWIASMNDFSPAENGSTDKKGDQPVSTPNRQRRRPNWALPSSFITKRHRKAVVSSKNHRKPMKRNLLRRPTPSESHIHNKGSEIREIAEPINSAQNLLSVAAECKEKELIIITDNVLMQNSQTKNVYTRSSRGGSIIEQDSNSSQNQGREPSVPVICVQDSDEASSDEEAPSESAAENRSKVGQVLPSVRNVSSMLSESSDKLRLRLVPNDKLFQSTGAQETTVEKCNDIQSITDKIPSTAQPPLNTSNESSGLYSNSSGMSYSLTSENNSLENGKIQQTFSSTSEPGSRSRQFVQSQSISNNRYTTQSSSNPANQFSQLAELLCRKSPKSFHRDGLINITKNISTDTVQNSSNLMNKKSSLQPQRSTKKHAPPNVESSSQTIPQIPLSLNLERPVEINGLAREVSFQGFTNNIFATQRLLHVANQSRQYFKQLHNGHYIPDYLGDLQQNPHVQDSIRSSKRRNSIDQSMFRPHFMKNETNSMQTSLNSANQTNQFLQHAPNNFGYTEQDLLRFGKDIRKATNNIDNDLRIHPHDIMTNVPSNARNYSNTPDQFNQHFLDQRQFQCSYQNLKHIPYSQNLRVDMSVGAIDANQRVHFQDVTKSAPSNLTTQSRHSTVYDLLRSPYTQALLPKRATGQIYINPTVVPQYPTEAIKSATQNISTQSECSCKYSHNRQFQSVNRCHTFNNAYTQKGMVDKSTETDSTLNHANREDHISRSVAFQNFSTIIADRSCQVDEWLMRKPPSPTVQQMPGFGSRKEALGPLDDEDCVEQGIPFITVTKDRPIPIRTTSSSTNRSPTSRPIADQEFLHDLFTLFNKMSGDLSNANQMFINFHEKIVKLNEALQKVAPSNETTSHRD
ncbi:hypothetical protein EVAR_99195_1 [Eumeta japonica]|uniref:Uncharacterized protein n=1 Tax=Eumeta variegata TaxID=151549 RepID=A0A4C1YNW9_EUMVA|nr:hypothetical protein EVAR_99195_1 [Eumeta japonica]